VGVMDYYSFGAEISMRSYEAQPWYRYGYQAQEKDHEIYGKGAMYYYKYRQHDARLGRFWSVDPLARKYPWNSPYAFAENDVVSSVELEGLERLEVKTAFFGTFGGDSRLRSSIHWSGAVGVAVGIPLWNNAELMIARQWTWLKYEGGLVGIGQPGEVVSQRVTSTTWVLGIGNAPGMPLYPFNSRTPSLFDVPYKLAFMVSSNYVRENDCSQKVPALGFRAGDMAGIVYNDYFLSVIPRLVAWLLGREWNGHVPDENETGGGQLIFRCPRWLGGTSIISAGTEVRTDKPMLIMDEDGVLKEATKPGNNGKLYYDVSSPQRNVGWWFVTARGESSNGVNWNVGSYILGGNTGMGFQNGLHDVIKNPRFKSPHPPGAGFTVGVGQTVRP
jgi:RHS repeat-associated protein